MPLPSAPTDADVRAALIARFDRARARTAALFDLVTDQAYYQRPISLRNPIVFYEGHVSAFAINALVKGALGQPGIDEELERLFARGIDPEDESAMGGQATWPSRDRVRAFVTKADEVLRHVLQHEDLVRPGHRLLDRAEAAYTVIEHEELHQETLHYIWHRLPTSHKRVPAGWCPPADGVVPARRGIAVDAGVATLGAAREAVPFAWDNEMPLMQV